MKIDNRLLVLFAPHAAALAAVAAVLFLMPAEAPYRVERPEILTFIDQLHSVTLTERQPEGRSGVKDVFRHEWTVWGHVPGEGMQARGNPTEKESVEVSLVVDEGPDGYCIINGKRMETGHKADGFTVESIQKDKVTIVRTNGTRETYHVKPY